MATSSGWFDLGEQGELLLTGDLNLFSLDRRDVAVGFERTVR
jgi:hypothetical protein